MGTVFILLLVPLVLWLIGEAMARWARAPLVWALFGFELGRSRAEDGSPAGRRRRVIGRQPDLPPPVSLHDRYPRRIVLEPEPDDDFRA